MSLPPAAPPLDAAMLCRGGTRAAWRRRLTIVLLVLVALAPIVFLLLRTADARRNVVYWDEIDTALALVIQLNEGVTPGTFLQSLFSVNNEHRMVTSRLLFAVSYWLSGTVNFALIDWIGNATLVAACLLLAASAGPRLRPLKLGLLLALLLFQLEHYENFLWSGASIDHFQVILFAVAAVVLLQAGTRPAFWLGGAAAALATFTLAHGLTVWLAGAALLWAAHRRRDLAIWGGLAALVLGLFLLGFELNHAQAFATLSPGSVLKIMHYWLKLLGAVPSLGLAAAAPLGGVTLLLLFGYVLARGAWRREPIAWALVLFALLSAGLIAVGRAEHAEGQIFSRYYVLSALAWALVLFMLLERHTHPRHPLTALLVALPGLIGFNALANREFADETDSWITCRDMAAVNFIQYGRDGHGPFFLHPNPAHSTLLLQKAEANGLYALKSVCPPVKAPNLSGATDQITYFVEEVSQGGKVAAVRGWAAVPGRLSRRGTVHLVLRSADRLHAFRTVTVPRSDVPAVMKQPGWTNAGFHFAERLSQLPPGDFQIGLMIRDGRRTEFVMTTHRLLVRPPGLQFAASAQQ
jgi:hypothetical protein